MKYNTTDIERIKEVVRSYYASEEYNDTYERGGVEYYSCLRFMMDKAPDLAESLYEFFNGCDYDTLRVHVVMDNYGLEFTREYNLDEFPNMYEAISSILEKWKNEDAYFSEHDTMEEFEFMSKNFLSEQEVQAKLEELGVPKGFDWPRDGKSIVLIEDNDVNYYEDGVLSNEDLEYLEYNTMVTIQKIDEDSYKLVID